MQKKDFNSQILENPPRKSINLFDSEGHSKTNDINSADLIVLNTCHIREKASEKVYSDIGRIKKIRKESSKLIISGCLAQAEGEEIIKRAPSVDYIVGPQSYHKLPSMIKNEKNKIILQRHEKGILIVR